MINLSEKDNRIIYNRKSLWTAINNDGDGEECGEDSDDVNELEKVLDGTLIYTSENDSDVAVYRCGDGYALVGDSYGPWVCKVS